MPSTLRPSPWRAAGAAVAALLALIRPAAAQDLLAQNGPFAIEQVHKRSSLQFSANYGFTRIGYVQLRVLHRGRPVALPDARGRKQTDFHDAWVLRDAPQPTVLVGGERWTLITERDGQPHVQALPAAASHSLQWVDLPAGAQPIESGRVRTQPLAPAGAELQGGRLLMFDDATLLDVRTLRVQPLATEVPAGYKATDGRVLGVAPDARALVMLYRGESNSPRDSLLVVIGTQRREQALLPLDMTPFTRGGVSEASLLERHARWETRGDALPTLRPLPPAPDTPWQTQHLYGLRAVRDGAGRTLSRFELQPVRPSMLEAARDHLQRECGCELAWITHGPQRTRALQFKIPTATAVIRLDAERRALVIEADNGPGALWAQHVTEKLGDLLEERLLEGGLREHLATASR